MKSYYTYQYLRLDGSPYYVGKGVGNRAWRSHKHHRPPKDEHRILIQYWVDEATALAYEIYLIDFWGRRDLSSGILNNHSDGGEGLSNPSETTRKKLILSHLGNNSGHGNLGRKQSDSEKDKRIAALISIGRGKGFKEPVEVRLKKSIAALGNTNGAGVRRTHCPQGHERSVGNIDSHGFCKECKRLRSAVYRGDTTLEEVRKAQSDRVGTTNHLRWHVNRQVINSDCRFCKEEYK